MKVARLNEHHRCAECRSPVANGVKICPVCKSYQDWRRHVAFSSTNLALLVALIAVLTPLMNLVIHFSKPSGSAISVLMTSATPTSFHFLARNDGRSQGVVQFQKFIADPGKQKKDIKEFPFDPDIASGVLVPSGSTVEIKLQAPALDLDKLCAGMPSSLDITNWFSTNSCRFRYNDRSFNNNETREEGVNCGTLPIFKPCVGREAKQVADDIEEGVIGAIRKLRKELSKPK